MNDNLIQFIRSDRGGKIKSLFKQREERALRLARIQNGTHPDFLNGHPKDQEKGRIVAKRKKKRRGY